MNKRKRERIQAKNWVFTLNNYTQEDENRLKEFDCEWMIFGHEKGENGTNHLQGALCFKGKRDFNVLKKNFPNIHWEIMQGTPADSKTYCTKEDGSGYFEKGVMPGSSKFTSEQNKQKWDNAYNAALNGNFDDIPRDMWIRYQKSFMQIYLDNKHDPCMDDINDKDLKDHFLWIWGPTGTGKSHTARRIAKELGCQSPYLKDLNKWWNGYNYQTVTIIDEASPKRCEYLADFFKKWCDKWPFTAECKGNVIPECRPQYIIVTSNYSIDACFPEESDNLPLHRRMTEICLTRRDVEIQWPRSRCQTELELEPLREPGNTRPAPLADVATDVDDDVACTKEVAFLPRASVL